MSDSRRWGLAAHRFHGQAGPRFPGQRPRRPARHVSLRL